jgi:hypothetical protein
MRGERVGERHKIARNSPVRLLVAHIGLRRPIPAAIEFTRKALSSATPSRSKRRPPDFSEIKP